MVRLWSLPSGEPIGEALPHGVEVAGAQVTGDGTRLLSWSADGMIRTSNTTSGTPAGLTLQGPQAPEVLLLPDDSGVIAWGWNAPTSIWRFDTMLDSAPMTHGDSIFGSAATRDGTRLLTWSADETAKLWDAATGEQLGATMEAGDTVGDADFSPDESHILTSSWSDETRIWWSATGEEGAPPIVGNRVLDSSDTHLLIRRPSGSTFSLIDGTTYQQVGQSMTQHGTLYEATFDRSGGRILASSGGQDVGLWDTQSQKQIALFAAGGARFSADGTSILWWSPGHEPGALGIRDGKTGQPLDTPLEIEGFGPYGAMFASDEKTIVGWSHGGQIRLWDRTGTLISEFSADGDVSGVLLSPDRRTLVAWPAATGIAFWDLPTGKRLPLAMPIEESIDEARFDERGARLVTRSTSGAVRLFDARTGLQMAAALRLGRPVWNAQFTADPTRLFLYGGKEAGYWRIPDVSLLAAACHLISGRNVAQIGMRYGVTLYSPICTPEQLAVPIDWATIERLPAGQ